MRNRSHGKLAWVLALFSLFALSASCSGAEGDAKAVFSPTFEELSIPNENTLYVVDHGEVPLGDRHEVTVEVKNDGSSPLLITSDPLAEPFGLDLPAGGLELQPGTTSLIVFSFEPAEETEEPLHTTIELRTNEGEGKTYGVRLIGRGIGAP